jgi:glutathione S-transferase
LTVERPVLFHDPTSEPSRAVHWLALEAGIDIDLRFTWLTRNEHLGPDLLRVNPRHQVPALQHGDLRLTEATAIMRYLADEAGCSGEWFGRTSRERARVNMRLSWYHSNVRRKVTLDYFLPAILAPAYLGQPRPDPGTRDRMREGFRECLEQLAELFEGGPFVALDRLTAADVLLASDLRALDGDPERDLAFGGAPTVLSWLERLGERQGYLASHRLWNEVAPVVRSRLLEPLGRATDPGWVAELCEAALRSTRGAPPPPRR